MSDGNKVAYLTEDLTELIVGGPPGGGGVRISIDLLRRLFAEAPEKSESPFRRMRIYRDGDRAEVEEAPE